MGDKNSSGGDNGFASLTYKPAQSTTQSQSGSSTPNTNSGNGDGASQTPASGNSTFGVTDTRGMSPVDQNKLASAATYGLTGLTLGPVAGLAAATLGYNYPDDLTPEQAEEMKGFEGRAHRTGGRVVNGSWVSGTDLPSQHRGTESGLLGSVNDDEDDDDDGGFSGGSEAGGNSGYGR